MHQLTFIINSSHINMNNNNTFFNRSLSIQQIAFSLNDQSGTMSAIFVVFVFSGSYIQYFQRIYRIFVVFCTFPDNVRIDGYVRRKEHEVHQRSNTFKKCIRTNSSYCLRRHSYIFGLDRQVRNLFSHEYANNNKNYVVPNAQQFCFNNIFYTFYNTVMLYSDILYLQCGLLRTSLQGPICLYRSVFFDCA